MPRTVPQGGRLRGRRLGPYPGCRMPELPDVTVYLEALDARIRGARLERLRLANPFVLPSVDPSPAEAPGRAVTGLRRPGKRTATEPAATRFALLHLMIPGLLPRKNAAPTLPGNH